MSNPPPTNPIFGGLSAEEILKHQIEVSQKNLDQHQETKNIAQKGINNIIFVAGTGTFVLSVSFLTDLDVYLEMLWLLIIAWSLLICSIIGNGMAYFFTIQEAKEHIDINNDWRRKAFFWELDSLVDMNLNLPWIRKWGNRASLFAIETLIAGIVCLTIFVSANLLAQNALRKNQLNPLPATCPIDMKG